MDPTTHPLKRCRCGSPTEKCPDLPRTLAPADLNPDAVLVFDVRREGDFAASAFKINGNCP